MQMSQSLGAYLPNLGHAASALSLAAWTGTSSPGTPSPPSMYTLSPAELQSTVQSLQAQMDQAKAIQAETLAAAAYQAQEQEKLEGSQSESGRGEQEREDAAASAMSAEADEAQREGAVRVKRNAARDAAAPYVAPPKTT